MAFGLEVKQVVQQINRRGAEAESSEGKQRFCQHRSFAQPMRDEHRNENDEIVDPSMRPQAAEQGGEFRGFTGKDLSGIRPFSGPGSESFTGVNDSHNKESDRA